MAHEEPLLDNPPTHEVAHHVRDYEGFVALFKWGAIISFILAMLVIWLIS
jgi:Bacterial aa3 type cytochrome c oxidase subunit IV